MSRKVAAMLVGLVVCGGVIVSQAVASARGDDFLRAKLSGEAEVPGPGDPDGRGRARVFGLNTDADPADEQLCFRLDVHDIAPATAAHIHEGPPGVAGPIVIHLAVPGAGRAVGCAVPGTPPNTDVTESLIADVLARPGEYYVNVHNAEYPMGAVRGQLELHEG
jgi:hypothetical protein